MGLESGNDIEDGRWFNRIVIAAVTVGQINLTFGQALFQNTHLFGLIHNAKLSIQRQYTTHGLAGSRKFVANMDDAGQFRQFGSVPP
eukprot:scaffold67762_cov49-Attheya_sp.AAC.3